jgi:hypothetical protein
MNLCSWKRRKVILRRGVVYEKAIEEDKGSWRTGVEGRRKGRMDGHYWLLLWAGPRTSMAR